MKVREILNLNNNLKGLKILAGEKGLDREIKDIEILEIPDGIYWINEGDLAITTAYFLYKEGSGLISWIELLNEKGAAGLGIKTDRFLKKIPVETIKKANELNFPLIEIPIHVGYSDMTWPIISKILGEKDYINFRLEKYNEELLNLSLKNYSTRDVFRIIKKYMKNSFVAFSFYNNKIKCITKNEKKFPIDNIISIINENHEMIDTSTDFFCINRDNKKIWINALRVEGEIIGYFSIISYDDSYIKLDLKIAKLSCSYLIVSMLLEKSYDYSRYNSKEDFLKSVIYKKITNKIKLKRDAAYYNITFDLRRIIWIMEINSKEELQNDLHKIYEIINNKVKYNKIHIIFENNKIICISSEKENIYRKTWFEHLLKEFEYKFPKYSFKIGVSKIFDSLDKLSIAYDEARFCLENGLKLEMGNIQLFDDLIVYYVLNEIARHPQLIRLYEDTIKKLKDHDINYGTELVKTISSYIENNNNVLKTAEDLYIHRNTLYKRIRKIESIIDLNIKSSDKNLIMSLGLKLHKLYSR
ncbi:PucR family transcriptional regulator [Crassaminicella profunda]|uniref:PucR family transcriptional regulator n=1 Tax=Crassaminicella profunda TaxID=1286698 RepID=UPI001CA68903|nr:PucR family transcriptional regulator [Crassaminicella profunda]QZY56628.1 PucR family transcriptional regulator ligand-binding domain-containing protein [Crassaminicella profunda]